MYLVLMVTNYSADGFFKLKQIENRLRTSMTQGRLVNLAIMSLELATDILREIYFTVIISDFAVANSRNCLVFDFRLCEFVWELQLGTYMIITLIIIIIILINSQ